MLVRSVYEEKLILQGNGGCSPKDEAELAIVSYLV